MSIQQLEWWQEELQEAGVPHSVQLFIEAELSSKNTGVRYPCEYPPRVEYCDDGDVRVHFDRIYRTRTFESKLKENPNLARFYHPRREEMPQDNPPPFYTPNYKVLQQSVEIEGGTLKLFEGIRDTWTAIAAGYYNVAGLFNATANIDDRLISAFQDLGVKLIEYYPDGDAAGLASAEKMQDVASGRIRIKIYNIPYQINGVRTKDTTDIWLALGQDIDLYRSTIENLSTRVLASKVQREYAKDNDYFSEGLYAEIRNRLGLHDFNDKGFSKEPTQCPFHDHDEDDRNPAFHWNEDSKIGYCFKRGTAHLAKDVADALNINVNNYKNTDRESRVPPSIDTPDQTLKPKETNRSTDSLLRVPKTLQNAFDQAVDFSDTPSEEFMYDLDFDEYQRRLEGYSKSQYPPIVNPFESMHKLGGLVRLFSRPLMVGMLGVSGGFKTTFQTNLAVRLSEAGHHGIIWTPEWNPAHNADRISQMKGGISMTEMQENELYYSERDRIEAGLVDESNSLLPDDYEYNRERIQETKRIIAQAKKDMRGRIVYINSFGANVLDLMMMLVETTKRMIDEGTPPSYFMFDYAQMAVPPYSGWTMNDTITYTKVVTLQLGLVTFMASQVRKDDVQDVMSDDMKVLPAQSGLFFRTDQFNAFWTLKPVYNTSMLPNRLRDDYIMLVLSVSKNSTGKTAIDFNDALKFLINRHTLRMYEWIPERGGLI